ncbi:hypothetical protein [Allosalinactinospora lopnorensis]|uniref:hypothetical protein n=1 Tax=Allosalinactinospora lopnorensis TaxID=1352348 RepID=UPI000623F5FE|nr:hypothetical protein [Allosalinactinospora lopnorensis]
MIDPTAITAAFMTIAIGIGLIFAGGIAYIVYDGVGRRRAASRAPAPAAGHTSAAARPHSEAQPA